jgi:VWFA-related protein
LRGLSDHPRREERAIALFLNRKLTEPIDYFSEYLNEENFIITTSVREENRPRRVEARKLELSFTPRPKSWLFERAGPIMTFRLRISSQFVHHKPEVQIMSRILALMLMFVLSVAGVSAQTQRPAQRPPVSSEEPGETIRISTSLVQADVVVTDKNDQPVNDLKLEDFELYDNGKKQNLKFMEWVSVETGGKRSDGTPPALPKNVESSGNTGVAAKDLKRVMAFVIDDLTMEIGDIPAVRHMLLDFVDNKMHDGDLVAIVRVVGGKGLLEQFTGDRQLLRRAIAAIRVTITPYSASNTPDPVMSKNPLAAPAVDAPVVSEQTERPEIFSANDDTVRYFRGLSALSTANYVINSLKLLPGRKNLILITGGVPLFQSNTTGYSNITSILDQLTDNAFRAGVVVNTLDPRGLRATPARSALGGNDANDLTFGRGGALDQAAFGSLLAGGEDHLGLSTVAGATGGIAVVNTNNFEAGLEKIIVRSSGYYSLSYSPGEKFDNKFH